MTFTKFIGRNFKKYFVEPHTRTHLATECCAQHIHSKSIRKRHAKKFNISKGQRFIFFLFFCSFIFFLQLFFGLRVYCARTAPSKYVSSCGEYFYFLFEQSTRMRNAHYNNFISLFLRLHLHLLLRLLLHIYYYEDDVLIIIIIFIYFAVRHTE